MNDTHHPDPLSQETPEEKIQRLLARMDLEDISTRGKSLDEQRLAWQAQLPLRYIVGPFLLGQAFDLWQLILGRIDQFLWGWAERSEQVKSSPPPVVPLDAKTSLRQALKNKRP